jgi:hypothetical protein
MCRHLHRALHYIAVAVLNAFSSTAKILPRCFGKSCKEDTSKGIDKDQRDKVILKQGNDNSVACIDLDRALAHTLQQEEEDFQTKRKAKFARLEAEQEVLAKLLQEKENEILKEQLSRLEDEDRALAEILQEEEQNLSKRTDPDQEQREMEGTTIGKAVLFVKQVIETIQSHKDDGTMDSNSALGIEAVCRDDMVLMVEQMLEEKAKFQEKGYNTKVDTGFHYTTRENIENIQANGLMSKNELNSKQICHGSGHGSMYGNGIYTANNPTEFKRYGEVGLIVARLKGDSIRMATFPSPFDRSDGEKSATTIIGNKDAAQSGHWPSKDERDEIVLKSASQVVALVRYNRTDSTSDVKAIRGIQREMQDILDKHLDT